MWAKKWRVLSWPWKNLRWKLDGFLWVKNEIPEWSGKNIYLTPLGRCYPVCALGSQHSECSGVGRGTATTSQLVPSPLHVCACVHTYLCGSRRFQRTLSIFPSVCWPRPNTFDWNVTPRGNSVIAPPPLQQLLPNTDRAPLCSRFTKVAISACSSAKRLAASGLHCNLVVMKAKKKREQTEHKYINQTYICEYKTNN